MSPDAFLRLWTVYDHPSDFPEVFIARQSLIGPGGAYHTANVIMSSDLEVVRAILLDDLRLTRIERDPRDDAKIVEVWV